MTRSLSLCLLVAFAATLTAQTPPLTVLEIEMENTVVYWEDIPDLTKWGKSPAPVPFVQNFPNTALKSRIFIADIVSVNGAPAKGVYHSLVRNVMGFQEFVPGRAIADVPGCPTDSRFVILHPDGAMIGSIVAAGNNPALAAPGAPSAMPPGITAVVGGTGAFLGARGQIGSKGAARAASIAEDPAYRRVNGGGNMTFYVQLVPMTWPEVLTIPTGPAIYHGDDFSPVTAAKPARAGEQLITSASGLGPVLPNLDPGQPFPPFQEGKLHEVNSPVGVKVNGKAAKVSNKIGWPAANNVYRVDFVVPDGTAAGMATLGLSVAWINGPEVKIPVR